MNFDQTPERQMLGDTLARYLADKYPFAHRTQVAYDAPFHDHEKWLELADLGLIQALVPDENGGFGGTGFDITCVFQTLGHALCPEPILAALLSARILIAAGSDLDPLMSGRTRYALALDGTDTTATHTATGWQLTGRKSVIYGGASADRLLVTARTDDGLAVFDLPATTADLTRYAMIDGGGAAELFLDATPATLLLTNAETAVQNARDTGALALCAEALGAMDASFDMLLDYLKTRQQFGRTIGSFQAIQHRMVDLKTEIEQARSICILAASKCETPEQGRYAAMAKNLIGRTGQLVAEELIQLHGGIAMTWEHPASHYAKRLVMIDHQLGDSDHHLMRIMSDLQTG